MSELTATTLPWKLLLLAAAALSVLAMALASPSQLPAVGQGPPVGLQANCTTICGDVIVPYPLGISVGCYLPGYNLTCNTSHNPPRLFLGTGALQVLSISLENSTVRVVGPDIPILESTGDGYVANGTWGGDEWGLRNGPYVLSEEYNELVVLGCQLSAELVIVDPNNGDIVINNCGSICGGAISIDQECQAPEKKQSRRCTRCSGFGCCQVPVPAGRSKYKVRVQSLDGDTNMPNSVFISEEGWFQTPYNYSNRPSSGIPAILAWAIVSDVLPFQSQPRDGNATCPTDLNTTSCHSSYGTCRYADRRYDKTSDTWPFWTSSFSYTCRCWDGYEGNPYIPHGCQGTSLYLSF
nr:unnamed protein product [Digitaria exilis]